MNLILKVFTFFLLTAGITANAAVLTSAKTEANSTYKDIEKTLGVVPSFMKAYPEEGISAAWEEFKSIQLSMGTELTAKEKELIGLAVAAQIPCKYCVYFHTELAKMNGATDIEIKEAIAMSASTRHWSTFLNGIQYSEADFEKETNKVVAFQKMQLANADKSADTGTLSTAVTNLNTAYKDIELTLGSVPNYMHMFPQEGLVGAWKMMKSVQLNKNSALSGKDKELLGLGVSAQIPCKSCAYSNTESAIVNGATMQEIHETVAMASLTRFWSTVLNGAQIDDSKFRKEVAQIIKHVKTQNEKRVGMSSNK